MGLCPNLSAYQSDDMKRIVYIDLLKGLAIIGIVLLHAGFDMFTASLYVPVFFMVSGYFFKRERMVDILKKRTRQLLLPYLWFVALFFLTEWLFDFLNVHGIVTSLRYTINRVHLFKNCTILHKSIWFLPGVAEKYADKLTILGIDVWEKKREDLDAVMPTLPITWPVIYTGDRDQSPADLYGVTGIPTLVLLSPDGTILARGQMDEINKVLNPGE